MLDSYDSYDLLGATDEFITRPKIRMEREQRFYPSEASVKYFDEHGDPETGGTCMRAAYFRLSGEYQAAPTEARTEYIFAQGKIIEQWLIDRWKEMGIWVDNNVKFISTEHNLSGELDVLLAEPGTGKVYGVEVKTFYGYMAKKELFGNKWQKGFPKMGQLLQTLVYLYIFRNKIQYFRMVYFARDSVDRRTFKIELHQEGDTFYPKVDGVVVRSFTVNQVFDRYKQLQEFLQKKIVPPNDYELQYSPAKIEDFFKKGKVAKTNYEKFKKGKLGKYEVIGDWECRYCKFKNVCWGENAAALDQAEETTEE